MMDKIGGFAIRTLFFLAIIFIFPQTGFSAPVVDDTKCLQCHTVDDPSTGLHYHSWNVNYPSSCFSCHTNTTGDTVYSSKCIVCHPAGDPGKQQLVDSHVPIQGTDCLTCHTSTLDVDNDGIPDLDDNCPANCNTQQLDADEDGIGDVCDLDDGCYGCGLDPICEKEC